MRRLLVAPLLFATGAALAQGQPQATPRMKLQQVPIPDDSSGPPPRMEGGVEVHEKKFWRDSELQRRAAELEVKIGRIWTQKDETHATVTVRNSSPFELEEIALRCSAVTQSGKELPVEERTLVKSKEGPLRPGYEKQLELTLGDSGAKVGGISCNARGY